MPSEVLKQARYPFSEIYGNKRAKTAIVCAAVNDSIKGVLLKGASGTAKTILARSITGIDPEKEVINVPLNVTDEMLFGTIDLEEAIATGEIKMSESILTRAENNYLYVDDADLLDSRQITSLMDAIVDGHVRVERESISTDYEVNTTLIASANTSRNSLSERTLDCFDMCVTMHRNQTLEGAKAIAKRSLLFSDDDLAGDDEIIAQVIQDAKKVLPFVTIDDGMLRAISELCNQLMVKGMRGPVATAKVAMTLAAIDGETKVTAEHVKKAAVLCLEHRRASKEEMNRKELEEKQKKADLEHERYLKEKELREKAAAELEKRLAEKRANGELEEEDEDEEEEEELVEGLSDVERAKAHGVPVHDLMRILKKRLDKNKTLIQENADEEFEFDERQGQDVDILALVGEEFETIDLLEAADSNGFLAGDDVAKRKYAESNDRKGKYVKSRITDDKNPDVAFDATIRAAAPYQKARKQPGEEGVRLEKRDLREKVRQKSISSTFLFLLDTSGSLIIRNRIGKVKAAINSMLSTHYVKRDRVGLMTFNEENIDLVLAPTRAIEQLEPIIKDVTVGQGTPISEALNTVYEYMTFYTIKHPDERCHIVMFTDGKATRAMDPNRDPNDEALEIAYNLYIPGADWIVIDTGIGYTKSPAPQKLAEALHGKFFNLDDLEKKEQAKKVWED